MQALQEQAGHTPIPARWWAEGGGQADGAARVNGQNGRQNGHMNGVTAHNGLNGASAAPPPGVHGNGHTNGHTNGNSNGNGNGNGVH